MQAVEPRLEQVAEVVERRREQAVEESSGLGKPFPLCGNGNKHAPAVTLQASETEKLFSIPALPFLDSGFRRNDEVAGIRFFCARLTGRQF